MVYFQENLWLNIKGILSQQDEGKNHVWSLVACVISWKASINGIFGSPLRTVSF